MAAFHDDLETVDTALPLEDYQDFLCLGGRRAPLTPHVHERGYRSATINTDALGMRYSHFAGKRFSLGERGGSASINLVVGGSVALGVGASSDEQTLASCLSVLTGEVWLNIAGCGLDATQELMLFLSHQHRLGRIGHVVILSGLNTLAHEGLCDLLACDRRGDPPPQPAAYFDEGVRGLAAPTSATLWQRLRRQLSGGASATCAVHRSLSAPEKRLIRAADRIGRTLLQWERLLADNHSSLTFVLQPLLPWCRETLPAGEVAMLQALERHPAHFDRLLEGIDDEALHSAFFRRIKSQSDPVACYDMNGMLSSSTVFARHLFVDRMHLNDLGQNALAKVITAKLGLAQEKQARRRASPFKLV
ncbi:hypothetical protein IAE35_14635 [Pseudomonas sp. S75]|uniref:hypothetical protein n=1 Tax=unclassified Pseudomonas TaxID=196821 RepID=UPI0019064DD0|nr:MULTISPECIES: hypothetical protein [unclassified Pseudomonas]MBJ9975840.1 hypothetical protein [Pseudomonas sp. S30]MBK0154580.1 hypothetical protein [Pseudomonas sp. S75]